MTTSTPNDWLQNASTRRHDIKTTRDLESAAGELRSRLLRMIVTNEQTRKSQPTHNQPQG